MTPLTYTDPETLQTRHIGLQVQYLQTDPTNPVRRDTLVRLVDEAENILAEAVAHLHPNDNFSRKLGRKLAFDRAATALATGYDGGYNGQRLTDIQRAVKGDLWDSFRTQVRL